MQESHVFQIPAFLFEDLMRCHSSWFASGKIRQAVLDDVVEVWESCRAGEAVKHLFKDGREWFIRLDQVSPKDSPLINGPVQSIKEVIVKLASSMRAYGALKREKEDADRQGRSVAIKAVLNPWNKNMDPKLEFRCFVPPPAARDSKMTAHKLKFSAISQYRWWAPFEALEGQDAQGFARIIHEGAERVLKMIVKHAEDELERGILEMLIQYGFTFDVSLQKKNDVQLIELNPFGALSGCGGCLFNWIRDARALY